MRHVDLERNTNWLKHFRYRPGLGYRSGNESKPVTSRGCDMHIYAAKLQEKQDGSATLVSGPRSTVHCRPVIGRHNEKCKAENAEELDMFNNSRG